VLVNGNETVDLTGKVCPYPVVNIIRDIERMEEGETRVFCVDDPLAIKSVPEELGEYSDLVFNIEECNDYWKIAVLRHSGTGEGGNTC
jgi:TusA-related sulfurtransferase